MGLVLVMNAGSTSVKMRLVDTTMGFSPLEGLVMATRASAAGLRQRMVDERMRVRAYTREHGEDHPEIDGWRWPGARSG